MVKLFGRVNCIDCSYQEDDPDMQLTCPHCASNKVSFVVNPKIILCPKNNTQIFAEKSLSKFHKQILQNIKGRKNTYDKILLDIQSRASNNLNIEFTSKQIIDIFNAQGITDGDTIRNIIHIMVCGGLLNKEFMKNKKYHVYSVNLKYNPDTCQFLSKIERGAREGVYRCDFDFKNKGTSISSKDIFGKK